ncbi:DUF4376 domain-containing protein [Aerobium aerolatum]|uniref:DUF4376 domain-containing protein n=1 Tax=Aquamicrobium aerolatum DSM 21857 TaxID=1121003 RepID=A0A1I3TAJ0_9HYPH|nr:DUF4376 domain-containing protein [Aquamicrobium aerolatum]SFJ66676.1 protein of unknown function [Aquamicrobium aerolatum DSM 21857]
MVMRKAVIDGSTVTNIIDAESDFTLSGKTLVEAGNAGIGWTWDGTTFSPPPPAAPTPADIDTERDRRIADGFMFEGKLYQSRPEDRENIAGASLAALAAMSTASPGDYRWHGGDSDFVWIAADNSLTPMDAQTMFAFGQAAMAHKQAHIFAARALKDAEPILEDYEGDSHWP